MSGPDAPGVAEPVQPLAVLDIDGVLADVRHRLHHLERRPRDWDAFFAAAAHDELLAEGAALAHRLAPRHEVLYLTGRPERIRGVTGRWLVQHRLPRGRLLMRPDRDRRPARSFKSEQVAALAQRRAVGCVVDDDPQVVALLREQGFRVELATWIPYARPLAQAQQDAGRS